ncbi:hypothetical protein F5883DRAFT_436465 [Diaporthe sp. PMI_573]|nr:hypothetical protein F5883DRAFT_436465 [Diaporthaceae sp. PMI_573]
MASNVSYPGAIPPPPGVIPDLKHPHGSRQQLAVGIGITCIGLASPFFFTRVYVRLRIARAILPEDGMHDAHHTICWLYIASTIYCPAAFFTKVSLLLLIARVFTVRRGVSTAIYIFIGTLFVAYTAIEVLKIIICIPIQAFWEPSVHGKCFNQPTLFVADTSIAILTDIVILLSPIPLAWSMRLPLKKKTKIVSIMGIGGIAVGITIWRVVLVVAYLHAKDITWWIALLVSTAVIELTIGLICSCIPTVNILIQERKYPGHTTAQVVHNQPLETSEPPLTKIDAQLATLARPNPATPSVANSMAIK